jgi:hypothetical protein
MTIKDRKKLEKLERAILLDKVEAYLILKEMHIPNSHAEEALK